MGKNITINFTEEEFRSIIRAEVQIALSEIETQRSGSIDEGFMSISEAADLLKLKSGSIYNLVNKQGIPFHKKQGSNRILFVKSELLNWLKEDKK
jgi:excisionase family DNA binding protein